MTEERDNDYRYEERLLLRALKVAFAEAAATKESSPENAYTLASNLYNYFKERGYHKI